MWNRQLAHQARHYADGVLTVVEDSGYPHSVRCRVVLDDTRQAVTFPDGFARDTPIRTGPACLVFHRHDARLENQYQLLIRGELADEAGALVLRPTAFVTANGSTSTDRMPHAGAPLQLLRFMRLGQKQAGVYLKRRGAPWPPIDFTPMLQIVREL